MPEQRVLIVDDEQRTLLFLRESLIVSGLNAETTCLSSAEEALQAFAVKPFEVVVTDVRLADMNGIQLLERLRQMRPGLRTILVSGCQDAELEAAARQHGIYHYFRKPFAFDEFTGVVASALREAAMDQNHRTAENWPAQFVRQQLTTLMRDTGAQGALLAGLDGVTLAQVGDTNGYNGAWPDPAGVPGPMFNFAYHQGKTHDVYLADIGNGLRLSLIFDRKQPSSRIGLVLQYIRRAAQELGNMSLAG